MEPSLSFNVWKALLREDCLRANKLLAFENFGDYVLELLWRNGTNPSAQGIITDGDGASETAA
jgi:hypothetical protein